MNHRVAKLYGAALSRSDRLDGLEVLGAGLAHEIANPLSTILANVSFALERLAAGEEEEVGPALADAKAATELLAALVRALGNAQIARGKTR